MIVVLTGAFRNVGDYLIGDRAIDLLREFCDSEIINLNRNNITEGDYEIMNRAKAVILCGGPAYQKNIYPGIYPLDLSKLKTKIVPLGLGWKGKLSETIDEFKFLPSSDKFIKDIHKEITMSSCRDNYTKEVLAKMGVDNVSMTGCPAWYDLASIEKNLEYKEPETIILSDPAKISLNTFRVIRLMKKHYPKARFQMAFHHGYYPRIDIRGLKFALEHILLAIFAKLHGFKVYNLAADLDQMKKVYSEANFHIGYRVHAHIFSLSKRIPSLILSEDSRGVGQSIALGGAVLKNDDDLFIQDLELEIIKVKKEESLYFSKTIEVMKSQFVIMKEFLGTI